MNRPIPFPGHDAASGQKNARELAGNGHEQSDQNRADLACFISPPAFWVPDHIDDSAWLGHAPFLFWLIGEHRPQSFVELGVSTGFSYFAACQAVQRLGLATTCYAVDWWKGDDHSGYVGPEIFERFRLDHDRHFSAFSRIVRSTFDEAVQHFLDGSIDLLHIDGRHFYEDVSHQFVTWRPKLSDRAIVLFHDTNVRERDFGIFKFWAEISPDFPHFEFTHGHGLGVLGVGRDLPASVAKFLAASRDNEALSLIRTTYGRLGSAIEGRREIERLREAYASKTGELDGIRVAQASQITDLQAAYEDQRRRSDELRNLATEQAARLMALEQSQDAKTEEIKTLQRDLEQWLGRKWQLEQELAAAQATLRDQQREADAFRHTRQQLNETIDALRAHLQELNRSFAVQLARKFIWPISHWLPLGYWLRRLKGSPLPELRCNIESGLSSACHVGRGQAISLKGWCYSPAGRLRKLRVVVDGKAFPVCRHSLPRPDVLAAHGTETDPSGNSLRSGFTAAVPISAVDEPRRMKVALQAKLANRQWLQREVGEISLLPGRRRDPVTVSWPGRGAKVAIAMTTCDPPRSLFAQQIASIRAQTHDNWVVVIADDHSAPEKLTQIESELGRDPRFILIQHGERLGCYRNFERCLERVPEDAEFVALADQDDRWFPDKIETLIGAMRPGVTLAYSDMVLETEDGGLISPTFWSERRNNYEDLSSLIVANTVTGAASLFRAELLDHALPFPDQLVFDYHDHWLALVARVTASIGYVARPLYAYVQHGSNSLGQTGSSTLPPAKPWRTLWEAFRDGQDQWQSLARALQMVADNAAVADHKALWSETLLLREAEAPTKIKRILQRYRRAPNSIFVLAAEVLRSKLFRRPTLNLESFMLCAEVISRLCRRLPLPEDPSSPAIAATAQVQAVSMSPPQANGYLAPALRHESIVWIHHNISPLRLDISATAPRRVNVFLQMIDFRYVFGGYLAMFNLALRLRREGFLVRLVLLDYSDLDLAGWRKQSRAYGGLETLFDEIEIVYRFDREDPLEVSPNDAFVATSCWSAHIAHKAVQQLGQERFLFLVQEFEPAFVPMDTVNAIFRQAYEFPHFALFSTEFLRDYFEKEGFGVFASPDPAAHSVTFRNPIHHSKVTPESLARPSRRLLFYARPEQHAARNLFQLGTMALVELVREGGFDIPRWSFHGLGSIDARLRLDLGHGADLKVLPRLSLEDYHAELPSFDVGLSLMLTPHPSLVPLEMAAAGMCTVTNTFGNKTAERLHAISPNVIAVAPTVSDIKDGLRRAMVAADDVEARVRGAKIDWPANWEEAFNEAVMEKVRAFFA